MYNKIGMCQETIFLIFDKIDKQTEAVRMFISINTIRTGLLQEFEGLPGLYNTGHEHTGLAAGKKRGPPDHSSSDVSVHI